MSKYCIIFCFCSFCFFQANAVCRNSNGMGTVLFTASDVHKQCWSPDEIAVLTTRMILEDILPDLQTLIIDSNEYVDDIVDYFRLMIELVRSTTHGRKKHITLLALTDLLGGYLQHAVLPIARHAYYSGIIDYLSIEKLIELFEELKWFLRTNGQGWSKPIDIKENEHDLQPIDFNTEIPKTNKSCCRNLIYYEHEPSKKRSTSSSVFLPIPFFDSKVRPTAIAVPFKRYALRNIESKKAAYVVMKYYISAYCCLGDLHADVETIHQFQNKLFTWVEKDVIPKLKDDKFYSAFGGILRVEETLRSLGAKTTTDVSCVQDEGEEEVGAVPGAGTNSRSSVVMMTMLITILVWFIIGTLFICYRIRRNNRRDKSDKLDTSKKSDRTTSSTSFGSSGWSLLSKSSSKRSTTDTCKCCTTPTEKSTVFSTSQSSDYDYKEETETSKKKEKQSSRPPVTYPQRKSQRQSYSSPCMCGSPAVIDTKHSMKVLPSIAEMSENSSLTKDERNNKSRRISFDEPLATSSKLDVNKSSKKRVCISTGSDFILQPCPHYSDKGTSLSSFRTKSGKELATQMSTQDQSDACWCPHEEEIQPQESLEKSVSKDEPPKYETAKEHSTGETTDDTAITTNSPHIYACHSSLTGNYTTNQKFSTEKPYIFGYDFQTSSSSEISDEDTDVRTSTSK